MTALPDPATFLSGEHGQVRARERPLRRAADRALDLWLSASGAHARLDALAQAAPERRVLVLSVYASGAARLASVVAELRGSRHSVEIRCGAMGAADPALTNETAGTGMTGGKFENLNALRAGAGDADWTLVVDDDVELPPRFLDRMIGVCEARRLALAQPAQTLASHAAWSSARRRPLCELREVRFVEIGPVTVFSAEAAAVLMPFPDLRFGWGLDSHWAALAADRGWRLAIVDALPVRHEARPIAAAYPREDAIAEAQRFLATRPYLGAAAARETVAAHRRLPA